MPIVRALTFFIPIENFRKFEKALSEYIAWVENILEDFPLEPWTVRTVLPPPPNNVSIDTWRKLLDYIIDNLGIDNPLIHGFSIPLSSKRLVDYIELLRTYDNLFGNIEFQPDTLDALDYLYGYDEPDMYTRMAVTFGKTVKTPYFPATSNTDNLFGFGIALRYVDLINKYLEGHTSDLSNYLDGVEMKLSGYGALYLGMDLSLSPWMEESVASIIEKHYGCRVGAPGSYHAVYNINLLINNIMREIGLKTLGFNEVMLPVGEDNRLMELTRERELRLMDLVGLTNVCVAGLDMVVIPRDNEIIRNVVRDLYSISRARGKTIAMRIIPSNEDEVYIGRFGSIPAIRV